MTDHVYDYDWQSAYPSLIKPEFQVHARGNGKSQAQLQMYDTILKGENEMNIKETLNKIYGKSAATNAAINSRDINQRRRERNKKYDKRALITAYLTNTAQNTYHIIPNDATRVNKPIIVDKYVRK